jgi:hypothetical protein
MRLEQSFITSYDYYRNLESPNRIANFEACLKDTRDKLRAKFETNTSNEAESKKVYVSSIAKWTGDSGHVGYAFVIKVGGHQWLVMVPLTVVNAGSIINNVLGSSSGVDSADLYFTLRSSTATPTESNTSLNTFFSHGMHYNSGSGSYGMGFTNSTTMRKLDGTTELDFFVPAHSPKSQVHSFMPGSNKLKGVLNTSFSEQRKHSIVIDNDKPFLTCYFGASVAGALHDTSWTVGSIIVPVQSGDTSTTGSLRMTHSSGTTSGVVAVYHPTTGLPAVYQMFYSSNYTPLNMWTVDGKVLFKSAELTLSDQPSKGFLNTDVIRVAGVTTITHLNIIVNSPGGPLTCLSGQILSPWGSVSLSERCGYFVDYPIL